MDGTLPAWRDGIPVCSLRNCPSFVDGVCSIDKTTPEYLCGPGVVEMRDKIRAFVKHGPQN